MRAITNKCGFTLIEVIASLVLIAIFVSVAGLGLINIVQGYLFTGQNATTIQEAQIAMTRIAKELGYATACTNAVAGSSPSITYTRPTSDSNSTPVTNTISLTSLTSGNLVQITSGATGTTDTLINNVTSFSLAYYDAFGNATTNVASIQRVDVALTVTAAGNFPAAFNSSIYLQGLQGANSNIPSYY